MWHELVYVLCRHGLEPSDTQTDDRQQNDESYDTYGDCRHQKPTFHRLTSVMARMQGIQVRTLIAEQYYNDKQQRIRISV